MPGFRPSPSGLASNAYRSPLELPPRQAYVHRQRIESRHDAATNQTRVALTTHKGMYFLWIQHPRVTFFYDFAGTDPVETPPIVSLLFRTTDPQFPANNRLTTICDGTPIARDVLPTFWAESGPLVGANNYTYDIPVDVFAQLVRCSALGIEVGGVRTDFGKERIQALRDFASRMAPK